MIDDKGNKIPLTITSDMVAIPSQNNEGRISEERTRIDWQRGPAWTRTTPIFKNNKLYQSIAEVLGQWHLRDRICRFVFDIDTGELIALSENGSRAAAVFHDGTITIDDWHMEGKLSSDGSVLRWSNGTVWRRFPVDPDDPQYQADAEVLGQWHFRDGICRFAIDRDTGELTAINEVGSPAPAVFQRGINTVSAWNMEGKLSPDGTMLQWSNGSVWHR